jgi:[acyl-carrier-protein] S-malonyltransferase
MGKDLYEGSPAGRRLFDTANDVLGYSLTQICFEGPDDILRQTEFTQPAIFVASMACLAAAIESGRLTHRPALTAGHSLGEYSALVAAGSLTFEEGLRLLSQRAQLMAEAGRNSAGGMAAILGLDEETVRSICTELDIDICNYNLPAQTVVGGEADRVRRAVENAKEKGGTRSAELNVSGAFHSRLMRPAAEGLTVAVDSADIVAPQVPVVANASASLLTTADAIRQELAMQVASPVRWHESVTLMAAEGIDAFIEFGPGKVLTGMVKRIVPGISFANVGTLREAAGEVAVNG